MIGAERRWPADQLSSVPSFLREGPFNTIRWALCEEPIADGVGHRGLAEVIVHHWAGGSWLVTIHRAGEKCMPCPGAPSP